MSHAGPDEIDERWLAAENIKRYQARLADLDQQRRSLEEILQAEIAKLSRLGDPAD